jgi:two-component system phosphate regulon sensor histidine kinase PhoR
MLTMKKRLKFIFLIALLTAGGIVGFQCFWIYNAYHIAKNNFYKTAATALQQSIDFYQLRQSAVIPSKAGANHVSVFMSHEPGELAGSQNAMAKTTPVEVTAANMQKLQLMMTRLLSQVGKKTVELGRLAPLFKAELKKRDIEMPFVLSFSKNNKRDKYLVAGYTGMDTGSVVIIASFASRNAYFLWLMLFPVTISLVLILVTAGCLYYMWYIIRKQVQLDDIKNDFINNMTHELKTPVAILKSTHEALDTFGQVSDPEKTLKYLRINGTVLNKLEANIERILDIRRYEQGGKLAQLEQIALKEYIEDILQRFSLNNNVTINFNYEMQRQTILSDVYFLEAVITNLVDNAVKYSGEYPVININVLEQVNGWEISIGDNGIGIASKDLPFIFDKFYRVPIDDIHDIKGFGLGLSYVKELSVLLGGKVNVQSQPGEGTIFAIHFADHG